MYGAERVIVGAIVLLIIAAVWAAVATSNSPKIELNKSEWACTKHETSIVMVPVIVGKITMMQARPVTRCACWERK